MDLPKLALIPFSPRYSSISDWPIQLISILQQTNWRRGVTAFLNFLNDSDQKENLAELRMALAGNMLCREKRLVAEVALPIDYESASVFSVAFKRTTGTSPGAFVRKEFLPVQ